MEFVSEECLTLSRSILTLMHCATVPVLLDNNWFNWHVLRLKTPLCLETKSSSLSDGQACKQPYTYCARLDHLTQVIASLFGWLRHAKYFFFKGRLGVDFCFDTDRLRRLAADALLPVLQSSLNCAPVAKAHKGLHKPGTLVLDLHGTIARLRLAQQRHIGDYSVSAIHIYACR